jgi:hypothetical protein
LDYFKRATATTLTDTVELAAEIVHCLGSSRHPAVKQEQQQGLVWILLIDMLPLMQRSNQACDLLKRIQQPKWAGDYAGRVPSYNWRTSINPKVLLLLEDQLPQLQSTLSLTPDFIEGLRQQLRRQYGTDADEEEDDNNNDEAGDDSTQRSRRVNHSLLPSTSTSLRTS